MTKSLANCHSNGSLRYQEKLETYVPSILVLVHVRLSAPYHVLGQS